MLTRLFEVVGRKVMERFGGGSLEGKHPHPLVFYV